MIRRIGLISVLAGFAVAANALPAGAAVTIGQTGDPGGLACSGQFDAVQPSVTSGTAYVVPNTGGVTAWTVTSWSNFARSSPSGQMLTMKVFRKIAGPDTYQVIGHDGPRPLSAGALNTFRTSLAVNAGDILGLNTANAPSAANGCVFNASGETGGRQHVGDLADGASGAFTSTINGLRVNVSAEIVPANTFTIGATTRNKKKGTATITIHDIPNPGELTGSGNGAKVSSAGAVISKSVGAGQAQLLIKAKGKKERKLNQKGKVKLNVALSYTPTGGSANTQSVKVKLKKELKR
jgi:hypothetical protein